MVPDPKLIHFLHASKAKWIAQFLAWSEDCLPLKHIGLEILYDFMLLTCSVPQTNYFLSGQTFCKYGWSSQLHFEISCSTSDTSRLHQQTAMSDIVLQILTDSCFNCVILTAHLLYLSCFVDYSVLSAMLLKSISFVCYNIQNAAMSIAGYMHYVGHDLKGPSAPINI